MAARSDRPTQRVRLTNVIASTSDVRAGPEIAEIGQPATTSMKGIVQRRCRFAGVKRTRGTSMESQILNEKSSADCQHMVLNVSMGAMWPRCSAIFEIEKFFSRNLIAKRKCKRLRVGSRC